MDKIKLI